MVSLCSSDWTAPCGAARARGAARTPAALRGVGARACRAAAAAPCRSAAAPAEPLQRPSLPGALAAAAAAAALLAAPLDAAAAQRTRQPPVAGGQDRCAVSALDLFAEVRPARPRLPPLLKTRRACCGGCGCRR
jgi:hypothetical protein